MKLFKNNIQHDKRVSKLSHKLNIDENIIEETLELMYGYIKDKVNAVSIEDESQLLNQKDFNDTFPIIHIPSLGYLLPNYRKYKHIVKNKNKKDEREAREKIKSQSK